MATANLPPPTVGGNQRHFSAYRATNQVTGNVYIGITEWLVSRRWARHVELSKWNVSKQPLHAAIRKYGQKAFFIEHVACCKTWADACAVEIAMIVQERSFVNDRGYNATRGGDGLSGYRHTKITCAKMSASKKGRPHTPEHTARVAAANRGRKQTAAAVANMTIAARAVAAALSETERRQRAYWKGKEFTPEHRAKLSAAKKGKPKPPRSEDYKANMRAVMLAKGVKPPSRMGTTATDEQRAKTSETMKRTLAAKRAAKPPD